MTNPLTLLGGRKFLLTVFCVVLVVFFLPTEALAKLDFLKWILGIYVVGNVTQRLTGDKLTPPAP